MKKAISIMMILMMMVSLAACGQETAGSDRASDYPRRAIEIVVPFGPGGSSDLMSRQVASIMRNLVGVPVNVVNRAGGGGVDGMVYVAQTPADGYTILQVTPSHAIAQAIGRPNANLSDDFEPIGNFQIDIQVFGVPKNSPFNNIDELIEYAKANPGDLKIGGTSPGGLDDYMANAFAEAAGIELTYVPYNSASETKAAALGGELDIYQDKLISFISMAQAGDIRPLIVLHDERLTMIEELKDVPTTIEKGIELTQGSWRGYAVRKDTPQEIKDYLAEIIEQVYNSAEYQEAAEKDMSNIIPGYIGAKEFGEKWIDEIAKFGEILAK